MALTQEDYDQALVIFDDLELEDAINDVRFEGFDVKEMFDKLWKKIKVNKVQGQKHLKIIVALGLFRGFGKNKTRKDILAKSSKDGAGKIESALNFFDAQVGKPDSRLMVTIPRIMICFPMSVYQMHQKNPQTKLTANFDLPLSLAYVGSPSVMSENLWREQRSNYVEWSMLMSELWKNPQSRADAEKFADLAYNNPMIKQDKRITSA